MFRKILFICIALILPNICLADGTFGSRGINSLSLDPPRMLSPIYDTAVVANNQPLEFKWMNEYPISTRGYVFHLYKGPDITEENLIIKAEVAQGVYSYQVPADTLQDGQTYTWTLIRVNSGGEKTDSSSHSFRVIKS